MTRDQIIKLARQASQGNEDRNIFFDFMVEELEDFAHLVAEHEREACAIVCDETTASWTQHLYNEGCIDCAKAIRARGQA